MSANSTKWHVAKTAMYIVEIWSKLLVKHLKKKIRIKYKPNQQNAKVKKTWGKNLSNQ